MTPKTGSLERGMNPVQLLSAVQVNTRETNGQPAFDQLLEGSRETRPTNAGRMSNQDSRPSAEPQSHQQTERPSARSTEHTGMRPEQGEAHRGRQVTENDASQEPQRNAEKPEGQDESIATPPADKPQINPADELLQGAARLPDGDDSDSGQQSDVTGESEDAAKLAVLAAVIAALRGNGATIEPNGESVPATTKANQSTAGAAFASLADGKPDGRRWTAAQSGAAAIQLAATNSADTNKQVATLRTPEMVNALSTSVIAGRSPLQLGGSNENPGNLPATAAITALRGESVAVQKMLVPTPAGQRLWAEDVANRVIWMAGRGEGRAELVLTPPNLGKLGVSIQMNGEQTTAHFVAASAAAREALEQALPRLREALQQAGISLGDTSVSTSGDQQAHNGGGSSSGSDSRAQADEYGILPDAAEVASSGQWTQVGNNLVDTFA